MALPPARPDLDALRRLAETTLARRLDDLRPDDLTLAATFDESPLEAEGYTALFTFTLPATAAARGRGVPASGVHYVAVGHTEAGLFPAFGLAPDDAYSLHIGQRFMVVTGVSLEDAALEPPGARAHAAAFVQSCNPDAPSAPLELAALFRCTDQLFAVYRVTLGGVDVYCLGADCPPGFHQPASDPPQVALALHLGRLIRHEARAASRPGS
jgi:hypothetical protein